jgi:hypothetical protein
MSINKNAISFYQKSILESAPYAFSYLFANKVLGAKLKTITAVFIVYTLANKALHALRNDYKQATSDGRQPSKQRYTAVKYGIMGATSALICGLMCYDSRLNDALYGMNGSMVSCLDTLTYIQYMNILGTCCMLGIYEVTAMLIDVLSHQIKSTKPTK